METMQDNKNVRSKMVLHGHLLLMMVLHSEGE